MRKTLLKTAVLICATLTLSCGFSKDSFQDIRVEAGVALPLGSISLTDSALFALAGEFSNQLHVDAQSKVLYIQLMDSLSLVDQNSFNSIFRFGTQSFNFDVDIPGLVIPPMPGVLVDIPQGVEKTVSLELPGGERLDEVSFGTGTVRLLLANSSVHDFSQLVVTIPQIVNKKTNQPLALKLNQNVSVNKDYVVKPKQDGGYVNAMTFQFSGKTPIVSTIEGSVIMTLDNLQTASGFFGRKEVASPTVIFTVSGDFEQFASMVDYLYFDDPRLIFDIDNQYNAPMLVTLDDLKISNQKLLFKDGYNSFFVPAKGKAKFMLDNAATVNGKQLSQLIGVDFENFIVDVNAVMNPSLEEVAQLINPPKDYVVPERNSFSMTDSLFGSYSVTIPFNAVLRNARFEQEVDIDLSSLLGNSEIDVTQFAFGFTGSNTMPLDVVINAYIKEGSEKVMLFEKPITIPASKSKNVLPAIASVIEGDQMLVGEVKNAALKQLFDSKTIFFELAASTKDALTNEAVKIFSPSVIDLNVIVGTVVDIEIVSKGQKPIGKVIQLTNKK